MMTLNQEKINRLRNLNLVVSFVRQTINSNFVANLFFCLHTRKKGQEKLVNSGEKFRSLIFLRHQFQFSLNTRSVCIR